jgi:hypothetical protein
MKWTYLVLELPEEDVDIELDNKGSYGWELVTILLKQRVLPSIGINGSTPRTETRFKLIFKKSYSE